MSVASSTSTIAYVGNNSTVTPYAVPFPFFVDSDLVVVKTDALGVDTILALSTDYTVTGAGGDSGSVKTVAAIDNTNKVTIYRDVAATQPLQYEEADNFPAASHEAGLDRNCYIGQQNARKLAAAFRLRESDGATNAFAKVLSALVGIGPDGLAKMFTGPEAQALLNLPATVVDQPTKTFLNAAARSAAVPDFLGQVGIQLDTSVIYSSSSVAAGAWVAVPLADASVTAAKLAAILDLSAKTITLPNLAVTAAMLAATLDLSGKTLTLPASIISGLPAITVLDDTDYFWFWDATDSALKKVSKASLATYFGGPSGGVVKTTVATYASNADLTVVIPVDDSIPQITEGTQVISQPLALSSSSNKILICYSGMVASAARATMAMFRDSVSNSIGAQASGIIGAAYPQCISGWIFDSPAETNPTYTLRVGDSTGTCRCNGTTSGRYLGGAQLTTVVFMEIKS